MGIIIPQPADGNVPRILRPSDANVEGTITAATAAGDALTVTIPASGAAMSNAASAPGFVWWDLGFTIQDVVDRYVGLRISDVNIAAGTSADAVLGVGFVYTNGTPDLSSNDYGWLQLNFGRGAAANDTCNTITRRSTNSIVAGDTVASFDFGDYVMRHQSRGDSRESFVGWTVGTLARAYNVSIDRTAIPRTLGVNAFVVCGRSAIEGAAVDVTFKAELLAAGTA